MSPDGFLILNMDLDGKREEREIHGAAPIQKACEEASYQPPSAAAGLSQNDHKL